MGVESLESQDRLQHEKLIAWVFGLLIEISYLIWQLIVVKMTLKTGSKLREFQDRFHEVISIFVIVEL